MARSVSNDRRRCRALRIRHDSRKRLAGSPDPLSVRNRARHALPESSREVLGNLDGAARYMSTIRGVARARTTHLLYIGVPTWPFHGGTLAMHRTTFRHDRRRFCRDPTSD